MSYSDYPTTPQSPGGMSTRRLTNRNTNRYSVTALFSMAAEQDVEVEDELGRGTSILPSPAFLPSFLCRDLKLKSGFGSSSLGYPLSRSATSSLSVMFVSSTPVLACSFRTGWLLTRFVA